MVRIYFTEPTSVEWLNWRKKCQDETDSFIHAVDQNEDYEVTNLYKEEKIRKLYYLNDNFQGPFWRKCAYCEGGIASQNGEIDHFRPKKRVSNDDFIPIQGHKGYYWLAYDWQNLLPSCTKCNQSRPLEKLEGKKIIGKQDRFPLEDETKRVFLHSGNLSDEKPLLINPLVEDPEEHLQVIFKTGQLKWNTARGKKCVDLFGLNDRDDLKEGRLTAINRINALITKYFIYVGDEDKVSARETLNEIVKYVRGEKQFSLAARCFLKVAIGTNYANFFEERLAQFE